MLLLYPLLAAHSETPPIGPVDAPPEDRIVYVYPARKRSDLLAGRRAKVQQGDFVIGNRLVRFVIGGERSIPGFPNQTGYLLDAGRVGRQGDLLGAATIVIENGSSRLTARYKKVEVVADGRAGTASLRASGEVGRFPWLRVTTEYRLGEWSEHLTIVTTLENRGPKALSSLKLGDYVKWTNASTFFPGKGFRIGKPKHQSGWIARRGRGSSFGWFVSQGKLATIVLTSHQGSRYNSAMRIFAKRVSLPRGKTVQYTRHLAIGQGDVADVTRIIQDARGEPYVRVSGLVREQKSGEALPGIRVRAYTAPRGKELVSEAETDKGGKFELPLGPGKYRLVAWEWGRPDAVLDTLTVGSTPLANLSIQMKPAGALAFEVRDENSKALLPCRLIIVGAGRTKNPKFVPQREDRQFDNVLYTHTGKAKRNVPPGRYRVQVTRGPEYTVREIPVRIESGQTTTLRTTLRRVVDTKGFISADFHLHTVNSQDSLVGLQDRVRSLVAENVEFAVPSDHNYVTDYRPLIAQLGLKKLIATIPGDEVTTDGVRLGHFNVFPVEPQADSPGEGAFPYYRRNPAEIFADARARPGADERVIQVNHPRLGRGNGYWNNTGWRGAKGDTDDKRYSGAFDAIEVFNGLDKTLAPTEKVMAEWFVLLNKGVRYTATGNSDSHRLGFEEVGYPRNFVAVTDDAPETVDPLEVVSSVRAGRVFVTNGPFLRVRARRAGDALPRPSPEDLQAAATRREARRAAEPRSMRGAPRAPTGPALPEGTLGDLIAAGKDGVHLDVEIQAAPWVDVTALEVIGNGETVMTVPVKRTDAILRYRGTLQLRPARDTWYIVVARGKDRLPVVLRRNVPPYAFSNPFWVDANGDDAFSPPSK